MLATNQILQGDCVTILKTLPDKSIDVIFADPPYFMQTTGDLLRTNGDKFSGIDDDWDKFDSLCHYDDFCKAWLTECRRVLKDNGSIWVIGSCELPRPKGRGFEDSMPSHLFWHFIGGAG